MPCAKRTMIVTLGLLSAMIWSVTNAADQPNILLIVADDMGYGDPGCYNADSKIPTPHIDRLAQQGMRFTDAHAAASVCIPSRYALLTGRYPFRRRMHERQEAVIEANRLTVPQMLRTAGYTTAMVGKWHLGFDEGASYQVAEQLFGGPVDRGFESWFGIHTSLDFEPYYYTRNRTPVQMPTASTPDSASEGWSPIQGAFWRAGRRAPDFHHQDVTPKFTDEAVAYLQNRSPADANPFFLYVAFPSPHTPWVPTEDFSGKSQAGLYGDFALQVDAMIGRILQTLDSQGLSDNTLVIFTSDNGPVWLAENVQQYSHHSAGPLKGMKGDAWEAGHRLPFIVRWPSHVEPNSTSDQLICFTDVLATLADVTGVETAAGQAEDSISFLPTLQGEPNKNARRTWRWGSGDFRVIRQDQWKLITGLGSGGFSQPKRIQPAPDGPQGQLYDLANDLGETNNLWLEKPEILQRLLTLED
ncbi:MAG: arylsulfatase [Planctomycetales bacterium]|nr:arylsulfatase [Planctomycetales bacterium]